jgi:hypothetical protein
MPTPVLLDTSGNRIDYDPGDGTFESRIRSDQFVPENPSDTLEMLVPSAETGLPIVERVPITMANSVLAAYERAGVHGVRIVTGNNDLRQYGTYAAAREQAGQEHRYLSTLGPETAAWGYVNTALVIPGLAELAARGVGAAAGLSEEQRDARIDLLQRAAMENQGLFAAGMIGGIFGSPANFIAPGVGILGLSSRAGGIASRGIAALGGGRITTAIGRELVENAVFSTMLEAANAQGTGQAFSAESVLTNTGFGAGLGVIFRGVRGFRGAIGRRLAGETPAGRLLSPEVNVGPSAARVEQVTASATGLADDVLENWSNEFEVLVRKQGSDLQRLRQADLAAESGPGGLTPRQAYDQISQELLGMKDRLQQTFNARTIPNPATRGPRTVARRGGWERLEFDSGSLPSNIRAQAEAAESRLYGAWEHLDNAWSQSADDASRIASMRNAIEDVSPSIANSRLIDALTKAAGRNAIAPEILGIFSKVDDFSRTVRAGSPGVRSASIGADLSALDDAYRNTINGRDIARDIRGINERLSGSLVSHSNDMARLAGEVADNPIAARIIERDRQIRVLAGERQGLMDQAAGLAGELKTQTLRDASSAKPRDIKSYQQEEITLGRQIAEKNHEIEAARSAQKNLPRRSPARRTANENIDRLRRERSDLVLARAKARFARSELKLNETPAQRASVWGSVADHLKGFAVDAAAFAVGHAVAGPLGGMVGGFASRGVRAGMNSIRIRQILGAFTENSIRITAANGQIKTALSKGVLVVQKAIKASGVTLRYATRAGQAANAAYYQERREQYQQITEEIQLLASNPQVMIDRMSQATMGLEQLSPTLAAHTTMTSVAAVQYLAANIPPTLRDPLLPTQYAYPPSIEEINEFLNRYTALEDPIGVYESVASGLVTAEGAEAVRTVMPQMHAYMTQTMMTEVAEHVANGGTVSQSFRQSASIFLGAPIDPYQDPQFQASLQPGAMGYQTNNQAQSQGATGPGKSSRKPGFSDMTATSSSRTESRYPPVF